MTGKMRIALVMAVLLPCGVAWSQAPMGGPGGAPGFGQHRPPMERALGPKDKEGRWWNDPVVIDKLKLTDDQRKSMDQILFQHREKLIDLRANVQKAELEMEPLMHEDQPNEGKIVAQIDKIAAARAELEKGNARFLLELRGKLTPEQWKALQELRASKHEHHGYGPAGADGPRGGGQFQHRGPGPGQHSQNEDGAGQDALTGVGAQ